MIKNHKFQLEILMFIIIKKFYVLNSIINLKLTENLKKNEV